MKYVLTIQPGNGGDGLCSFKTVRGKRLMFDGGKGGSGGNICIKSSKYLLPRLKDDKVIKANNGYNGAKHRRDGKKGDDLEIQLCNYGMIKIKGSNNYHYTQDINSNSKISFDGGKGGLGSCNLKTKSINHMYYGERPNQLKLEIYPMVKQGISIIYLFNTKDFVHKFIKENYHRPLDYNSEYNQVAISGIIVHIVLYKNYKYVELMKYNYANIVVQNNNGSVNISVPHLSVNTSKFDLIWTWLTQHIAYR